MSLRNCKLTSDVAGHVLKQEVKWAHYEDHICETQDFKVLLKRYAAFIIYLQYVTTWHDNTCTTLERLAMTKHLKCLPLVAFSSLLLLLPGW